MRPTGIATVPQFRFPGQSPDVAMRPVDFDVTDLVEHWSFLRDPFFSTEDRTITVSTTKDRAIVFRGPIDDHTVRILTAAATRAIGPDWVHDTFFHQLVLGFVRMGRRHYADSLFQTALSVSAEGGNAIPMTWDANQALLNMGLTAYATEHESLLRVCQKEQILSLLRQYRLHIFGIIGLLVALLLIVAS